MERAELSFVKMEAGAGNSFNLDMASVRCSFNI